MVAEPPVHSVGAGLLAMLKDSDTANSSIRKESELPEYEDIYFPVGVITTMKQHLSVYLEPDQLRALIGDADRKVSKSVLAEAATASFVSPDTAERQEGAIIRRLDRLTRQLQRCDRDIGISL